MTPFLWNGSESHTPSISVCNKLNIIVQQNVNTFKELYALCRFFIELDNDLTMTP